MKLFICGWRRRWLVFLLILLAIWGLVPGWLSIQTSFLTQFRIALPHEIIGHASLANWRALPWSVLAGLAKNSAVACFSAATLSTLVSVMAGFGFAKYEFPFKEQLFWMFLLAMMVPGMMLFLPKYLIVRDMGLINTFPAIILPCLLSPAMVFLSRQYLASIPHDIIEAARIDGASDLQVFRRIILPLALPIVVLCFISEFGLVWGDFIWQFIAAREIKTLTVGIGLFLQSWDNMAEFGNVYDMASRTGVSIEGISAACAVLQSAPMLAMFAVGQKWFVKGVRL